MKSERRHELQHNALADWLIQTGESLKPYQNMIWAAVATVLVVGLGYALWSRQSQAQTTQAWDDLNMALENNNAAALLRVIDNYPGTHAAHAAAAVVADFHLADGCGRLFSNKAAARQELGKAIDLYQTVLDESRQAPLRERATFGMARANEAKGDLVAAEKLYAEVAAKWSQGAYAAAANRRAADLKHPATKRFYDDFAQFDPQPAFSKEPAVEKPGGDISELPAEPSADLPPTTFDLKPDTAKSQQAKPSENEKPAATEESGKK